MHDKSLLSVTETKRFQTLRAALALKGWALLATDDPRVFLALRWGRDRVLRGLDEVQGFVDALGGTHACQ